MNKAKIILSVLAIFAVVGGALAFKATRFGTGTYFLYTATSITTINGVQTTYSLCQLEKNWVPTLVGPTTLATLTTTSVTYTTRPNGPIFTINGVCTPVQKTLTEVEE